MLYNISSNIVYPLPFFNINNNFNLIKIASLEYYKLEYRKSFHITIQPSTGEKLRLIHK